MFTQWFISIFIIYCLIINGYTKNLLKEHIVGRELHVSVEFFNIKKVDRNYNIDVEGIEERKTSSSLYQDLIFYDDHYESLTASWNIYSKTRGTRIYTVNVDRNSNICNKMRNVYDIPLIIEFAEKGLVSFQYRSNLDIEKMDSFLAYINHLHSQYTISVAYLSKKYEYNEIEMRPETNTTFTNSNWRKIKYTLKLPQYKHLYKYLLIRNNGPHNIIFIGRSAFLPDDIMFYSDEGGVNTDYMYLVGEDLTNINRNGYFSITSLTSVLNFSMVFNNNNNTPITNMSYFEGLSFFIIKSSGSDIVNIEFSINTSIGDFSTTHTIHMNVL
ncbi:hypothetical protein BCR32DRAFT_272689 [Anaeromyces robustus]|uniref:Uncharacterized protein n=1 Tax=Anaeromyces robustus TaxID=1754192 RepID=A0A1Y1VX72_9FUNG|nr:hypothetical protein BCR32DRAFT_272689 [Anaeromyces robustus]|eukprot:ORX65889.1 hypothetical protein BCR32DRAFT_272689 [Anaeromyces robustus]